MEEKINIQVRLLYKDSKAAITGEHYSVQFHDEDLIQDDDLGSSGLDGNGIACTTFVNSDFQSADSPLEKYPDLYFTLHKDGNEIYKSPVCSNMDVRTVGDFEKDGWNFDLGTFLIEA